MGFFIATDVAENDEEFENILGGGGLSLGDLDQALTWGRPTVFKCVMIRWVRSLQILSVYEFELSWLDCRGWIVVAVDLNDVLVFGSA